MHRYPSAETVPYAGLEYVLFGVWLSLSSLVIGLYGWHALVHGLPAGPILVMIGIGLLFCLPFALAGFFFRTRRLKRLAARQAFLAYLDRAIE